MAAFQLSLVQDYDVEKLRKQTFSQVLSIWVVHWWDGGGRADAQSKRS